MKEKQYAITTIDNPFNPFDEFTQWWLFDVTRGYNTCAWLARLVEESDALSDSENDEAIGEAIDRIIEADPFGIYKKMERDRNPSD